MTNRTHAARRRFWRHAGVLATNVAQRTREIGIRMALGETRASVLRSVVRRGLILTAVGLLIGFIGAMATTRFLAAYLYATEPSDPLTLLVVAVAFVIAALLACAGPAWRAIRVDPMIALRAD